MEARDRIIGLICIGTWVLAYRENESIKYVIDSIASEILWIIESFPIVDEVVSIWNEYPNATLLTGLGLAYFLWKWSEKYNSWKKKKRFENKDFDDILSVSCSYITPSWDFIIENEAEWPIDNFFRWEEEIGALIRERSKYTSAKNIIIKLPERQEWVIYEKLRSNYQVYADRQNVLWDATDAQMWVLKNRIVFISVLTKEPKFKIQDDETVTQATWKLLETADTKSEIRLLTFPEKDLKLTLNWCKNFAKSMWSTTQGILDCLCNDENDNCQILDAFIRYKLRKQINSDANQDTVSLLRWPTHRKRFVAMAQVSRYYEDWWAHMKTRIWVPIRPRLP